MERPPGPPPTTTARRGAGGGAGFEVEVADADAEAEEARIDRCNFIFPQLLFLSLLFAFFSGKRDNTGESTRRKKGKVLKQ